MASLYEILTAIYAFIVGLFITKASKPADTPKADKKPKTEQKQTPPVQQPQPDTKSKSKNEKKVEKPTNAAPKDTQPKKEQKEQPKKQAQPAAPSKSETPAVVKVEEKSKPQPKAAQPQPAPVKKEEPKPQPAPQPAKSADQPKKKEESDTKKKATKATPVVSAPAPSVSTPVAPVKSEPVKPKAEQPKPQEPKKKTPTAAATPVQTPKPEPKQPAVEPKPVPAPSVTKPTVAVEPAPEKKKKVTPASTREADLKNGFVPVTEKRKPVRKPVLPKPLEENKTKEKRPFYKKTAVKPKDEIDVELVKPEEEKVKKPRKPMVHEPYEDDNQYWSAPAPVKKSKTATEGESQSSDEKEEKPVVVRKAPAPRTFKQAKTVAKNEDDKKEKKESGIVKVFAPIKRATAPAWATATKASVAFPADDFPELGAKVVAKPKKDLGPRPARRVMTDDENSNESEQEEQTTTEHVEEEHKDTEQEVEDLIQDNTENAVEESTNANVDVSAPTEPIVTESHKRQHGQFEYDYEAEAPSDKKPRIESTPTEEQDRNLVGISLAVPFVSEEGWVMRVSGNHESIGNWDRSKAKTMTFKDGTWSITVKVPEDLDFVRYQYLLTNPNNFEDYKASKIYDMDLDEKKTSVDAFAADA